jgi:hypothetical protein
MQMTSSQEESWQSDANVYIADEEEDMFSVRTSGELVLEELLRSADGAAGLFAAAVRRRLDEAAAAKVCLQACTCNESESYPLLMNPGEPHQQSSCLWYLGDLGITSKQTCEGQHVLPNAYMSGLCGRWIPGQAAGDEGWWRLREAALLAVGAVSDPLLEAPGSSDVDFDLASFLQNVLHEDLQSPGAPPFLAGRALWVAARCGIPTLPAITRVNSEETIPQSESSGALLSHMCCAEG